MKLQCLLKHNNFINKCAKQNNNKMNIITIQFKSLKMKNKTIWKIKSLITWFLIFLAKF